MYGVTGSPHSMLYIKELAYMTTGLAKWMLENAISILEEAGYSIVFAHTDSCFFEMNSLSLDVITNICNTVNEECKRRFEKEFGIKYEHLFYQAEPKFILPNFYIVTTSNYIGETIFNNVLLDKPAVIVAGLQLKKKSSFALFREVQLGILKLLLKGKKEEIKDYVYDIVRKMQKGRYDDKLIKEQQVNKDIAEYKGRSLPQVRIVEELAKKGLFKTGDTIRFVITLNKKDGKTIREEAVVNNVVPKISEKGYAWYAKNLIDMVNHVLGEKVLDIKAFGSRTISDFF